MKRAAQLGEGEIPIGASEVPGGGPQAFTCPDTGERVIEDDTDLARWLRAATDSELAQYDPLKPEETPVKAPKARKRK